MNFINKDNYNQFEIVMQNHSSYDLEHNDCIKKHLLLELNLFLLIVLSIVI